MKKWMALLLAVVLLLSFTACSGGEGGKEISDPSTQNSDKTSDDENAIEATWEEVFDDIKENEARARNNVYKVTGEIKSIANDYCEIGALRVYLPSDILASLDPSHTPEITIIGKITDVYEEEYYQGLTSTIIEFGEAELVELHGVGEDSEYEMLTEDKFSEDMIGKTYKFTAHNVVIYDEADFIDAFEIMNNGEIVNCPYSETNTVYSIYLSEDEMKNIKNGDDVTIIGTVFYEDIGTGNDGPYARFAFKPAMVADN